jgi:hypothetical protein
VHDGGLTLRRKRTERANARKGLQNMDWILIISSTSRRVNLYTCTVPCRGAMLERERTSTDYRRSQSPSLSFTFYGSVLCLFSSLQPFDGVRPALERLTLGTGEHFFQSPNLQTDRQTLRGGWARMTLKLFYRRYFRCCLSVRSYNYT